MDVNIVSVKPASSDVWDRTWQECSYSTYFHSRAWNELWADYTARKIKPTPLLVTFSDGLTALLPLSCERIYGGLAKRYVSSPAGTYGGWISVGELAPVHAELLSRLFIGLGSIHWQTNPYSPLLPELSSVGATENSTQRIDLTRSREDIMNGFKDSHRRAVKKARRAKIQVRQAVGRADWEIYFEIYRASLQRWGASASSHYEWSLFELLSKMESPSVELWLAELDERVVAGALCLSSKNVCVYWHGGALEEFFLARPINVLMEDIIFFAKERGQAWFDFNPSGGHEGVKNFKRGFGAEEYPCPTLIHNTPALTALISCRHKIKEVFGF